MSRSYKKHPGWCDRNPFYKKVANRKVRRCSDVIDGSMYKKIEESWKIHDYKNIIWTKDDLRYADMNYKEVYYNPPKRQRCLKELKKTKSYRKARMK